MTGRARNNLGMTLVELMIVVVIIGILAAISVVGYSKYRRNARVSEATAMLAEFVAKEQLYFLDNGQYTEVHNYGNDATPAQYPSTSEFEGEFWPHNPSTYFDSARTPAAVQPLPALWRALGVRPRWQQLYCTYMVNAGAPGSRLPGTVGPTLWPASAPSGPNVPWFYAMAVCNLNGQAGWPNTADSRKVTVLVLTHDSPAIQTTDETQ